MAQLTGGVKSAHGPHREHQQERPVHNHEARSPEVSVGGSHRELVKSWDCKPTLRGPVASAHHNSEDQAGGVLGFVLCWKLRGPSPRHGLPVVR